MKRHSTSDSPSSEGELLTPELEENIRVRAYELYEQRGRLDGHDLEDWLKAESELTGKAKTAAA